MQFSRGRKYAFALLILISVCINVYFRLNTLFFPRYYKLAKKEVFDEIKKAAGTQVSKTFPDLPPSAKSEMVQHLFKDTLKRDSPYIKARIEDKSKKYHQYWQDERLWTYLLEIDPYRSLRRVENFLQTGHLGTKTINGVEIDEFTAAPPEHQIIKGKWHYYIGAYFYKILHFFNKDITPMEALSVVPVILSIAFITMLFIFFSLLKIGEFGSFAGSLCAGLAPAVVFRTTLGWFDTDIYNILLPLMIVIVASYIFAVSKLNRRILFLIISGILVAAYASIWIGWWYIFYIIIFGTILYIIDTYLVNRERGFESVRQPILFLGLFITACSIFVLIFSGLSTLKDIYSIPSLFLSFRDFSLENFWPNPGFTVSELKTPSVCDLVFLAGGNIILFGGIIGILSLFLKGNSLKSEKENFLRFVLFVWFLFLLIAIRRGSRFIFMFCIPVGIGFGIFIDQLYRFLKKRLNILLLNGAIGIFLIIPINNARYINITPIMNDSWWKTLVAIRETAPKEAIINTWWDCGDWFATVSRRKVINDAYFQYTPLPYWMARILLTDNEKEAIGILKMIDSGSYRAFYELYKHIPEKLTCLKIINKLVMLEKQKGYKLLETYIKDKAEIDKIFKLVYGPPPPAYFVVDDSMLLKFSAISFLGKWDFEKLDIWQKKEKLSKEVFLDYLVKKYGYTKDQAYNIYKELLLLDRQEALEWISPKKSFTIMEETSRKEISEDSGNLFFDNGLVIDMRQKRAFLMDVSSGAWLRLKNLMYIKPGNIEEFASRDSEKDLSVLLIPQENSYRSIVLDEELARSLFVRLFFMNGINLKHFKLVFSEKKEGFSEIYVYRIIW